MERPVEVVAIVGVIAVVGTLVLGERRSLARQAVIGSAIGLASAAIVISQSTDLVPDGLEGGFNVLLLAAVTVLLAIALRRRTGG